MQPQQSDNPGATQPDIRPNPVQAPQPGVENTAQPVPPSPAMVYPAESSGPAVPVPVPSDFPLEVEPASPTGLAGFFNPSLLDRLFAVGFATIFLTNAWTALAQPASFLLLIENNFLTQAFGHYQFQLGIIAVNDFILGILILSGYKKPYVRAWAGVWLIIVTFLKITSLT